MFFYFPIAACFQRENNIDGKIFKALKWIPFCKTAYGFTMNNYMPEDVGEKGDRSENTK